ncbi:serine hydroxymethyltransferase 7-like [Ananas comosus]|uniref:glycine hydroxymethyltransferase n=1 Tax=Ananas comosus TaxID=4615 RepID=A0A199UL71_ANACO|nr:serine hydroxymethyltransferase 7-like [Ananas comosus]OAY65484.1 Serine hydroxymethyltransferase 7 [Ananas comosus]
MDLTGPQSKLSLGFHHAHGAPIATNGSISLQIDSRHRDLPRDPRPIPLQLLDQQSGNFKDDPEESDDEGRREEAEDEKDEEFSFLGHQLSLKRRRRDESSSSCSSSSLHPSKRALIEPDLETRRSAVRSWGNQPLSMADPDVCGIMEKERDRQVRGIELIASENFVCRAVLDALGSHLTNKYSEGLPGARYYGGNQYIDQIERLCHERALAAFDLDPECWGVNVQPYSCTSANFAVYTGLLLPKDRIMGLDSPSGGHVSHGYHTPGGKKISGASIFFECLSYKVNPQTGYIDYDKLEEKAIDYRPKILICGGSSYPREWDYPRLRQIANKCGAVLMCDMAHISGLVAAKECLSPFDYCDIVTSTTHKLLRGPRGGIIFFRKGKKPRHLVPSLWQADGADQYDFEDRINFAVFPSLQGGPHNSHIAALAIALKQVATPEYKAYIQQVKKNAQALASALLSRNCKLVTGGTDNHLLLWDLRTFGLTGKNFEKVCEACHISVNKTTIYGDNGTISSGGIRIGTPAMTTRGCLEGDFETIAEFLLRAAQIASSVQREHGKQQREFLKGLQNNRDALALRNSVETFASQFAMPGFDV